MWLIQKSLVMKNLYVLFVFLGFYFLADAQQCGLNCGHKLFFQELENKHTSSNYKSASNSQVLFPQQATSVLGGRSVLFIRGVDPSTHTWQSNDTEISTLYTELDNYVRKTSYNQAWIDTWDVTPIYNFSTNGNTSYTFMSDELAALALAGGYDINDYNVVYYTYASNTDLNGAGALGIGNGMNGSMWMPSSLLKYPSGVIHETFHAFGTEHANDWEGGSVMFPGSLTGGHDPYYFMGSQGDAGLNSDIPAYFKYWLGWLSTDNIILQDEKPTSCSTQRIYKTSLINTYDSSRKYSVQLGNDLWLSYEPDNNNTQIVKKGVLLHYIPNPSGNLCRSYILDPLPESITIRPPGIGSNYDPVIDFWDAALELGDEVNWMGTSIRIVNTGGTGDDKWVDIEFCDCLVETGDSDNDGVCDADDICAGFDDNIDSDSDNIPDGCDTCPNSPTNDSDGNNICDNIDCFGASAESFEYTPSTTVNGNGGNGFSGIWSADIANGNIAITSGSLSNDIISGSGNKLNIELMDEVATKGISRDLDIGFIQGETVWLSVLINAINRSDGGLWIRPNGSQNIAIGKRWGTNFSIDNNGSSITMLENQTYWLVAKYELKNDETIVSLWINPSTNFTNSVPDATKTTGAISGINSIFIGAERWGNGHYEIDELSLSCEAPNGILDCNLQVGQNCDDGNPDTFNDIYDTSCNCIGTQSTIFLSKIMLEGFMQTNGELTQESKDLDLIPLQQPFNTAPWNYAGTETLASIPADMVDWVLIHTRDANGNITGTQAALLYKNGDIRTVNESRVIKFALPSTEAKHISVHHKSHLAVVTEASGFIDGSDFVIANIVENPEQAGDFIPNLDFTLDAVALGIEQVKFMQGTRCAISGDFDGNGIINNLDYNVWEQNNSAVYYYLNQDADGNGIVNNLDYNLWDINKSKVGNQMIQN